MVSARFMRKLRLLTRIYDVPLIFDEVQTGWGMTGRLWAHEHFDLPCPPDVVTWDGWQAIDAREREQGEPAGRPRIKLVRVADLVAAGRGTPAA